MAQLIQKIISFLMSFLALFGLGNANNANLHDVDDVTSYTLESKSLIFDFKANASTGYTWVVTEDGNSIKKINDTYKSDVVSGFVGEGGTQEFSYASVRPGTTTLTFRYLRTWEDEAPVYTYVAVVSVGEDLQITVDSFAKQ